MPFMIEPSGLITKWLLYSLLGVGGLEYSDESAISSPGSCSIFSGLIFIVKAIKFYLAKRYWDTNWYFFGYLIKDRGLFEKIYFF